MLKDSRFKIKTCGKNIHLKDIDSCEENENIGIRFSTVEKGTGDFIESHLHYLRIGRLNAVERYGLFIKDHEFPICYMSFCSMDRYYRPFSLASSLEINLKTTQVINLARVYGFGNLPKNSISKLLSYCTKDLLEKHKITFITTAVNPLLGFRGTSMLASGFIPFAYCPVCYIYDKEGQYISRRIPNNESIKALMNTPPNLLLVKGTNVESRDSMKKIKSIFTISEELFYNNSTIPHDLLFNLEPKEFNTLRHELEKVWSSLTRYHGTPIKKNDPVSKGQCGVTTALLAKEFDKLGYNVLFCEGNVFFPNNTPPIENHCWLKIPHYKGIGFENTNVIIDLTSDQSGFSEPVICDTLENLEKRGIYYKPMNEQPPSMIHEDNDLSSRLEKLQSQLAKLTIQNN